MLLELWDFVAIAVAVVDRLSYNTLVTSKSLWVGQEFGFTFFAAKEILASLIGCTRSIFLNLHVEACKVSVMLTYRTMPLARFGRTRPHRAVR